MIRLLYLFIFSWSLKAFGFHNPKPSEKKRAYTPTEEKLKATMKMELDSSKRVVLKRAQKPLGSSVDKKTQNVDKKKLETEIKDYYSFLNEISKVFSRRQLEDLGIDSRDLATLYDEFQSRSRPKYESEVEKSEREAVSEKDYGYDYKRGYNTQAYSDVLDLGDETDKNTAIERENNREFENSKNREFEDLNDKDFEDLKREILSLWEDFDKPESTQNSYIEEYYKRKKELERQKRINDLLNDLDIYLKRKK